MGRAPYTVSLEFSCTTKNQGIFNLWSWGSPVGNSANAFHVYPNAFNAYWYGNDLQIASSSISLAWSTMCDGSFHNVASSFDGKTRRIFYEGVQIASDTPAGAHANRNDNLCIGGEDFGRGNIFAFVGTIRNFRVWGVHLAPSSRRLSEQADPASQA
eukprot:scaffold8008_cov65-Phaeocystis_antarctica.AAC.1